MEEGGLGKMQKKTFMPGKSERKKLMHSE